MYLDSQPLMHIRDRILLKKARELNRNIPRKVNLRRHDLVMFNDGIQYVPSSSSPASVIDTTLPRIRCIGEERDIFIQKILKIRLIAYKFNHPFLIKHLK